MIIRAAGNKIQAFCGKRVCERFRVIDDSLLVFLEFRFQRLAEADRLAGDHVHERATLRARENCGIEFFDKIRIVAEDESASRPS